MIKEAALSEIASEIISCPLCRRGGTGKPVPGEGNPDAAIMFIGEAPGIEESKTGRPFMGRAGKFLRETFKNFGLSGNEVFITSPVHYFPVKGTPSKESIIHGRTHLIKQLTVIDPKIIVLLGNTACLAMLDRTAVLSKEHGSIINDGKWTYLLTVHPAYAMRFPRGREIFIADFHILKELMNKTDRRSEKGKLVT